MTKGISTPPSKFVQVVDDRSGAFRNVAANIPFDDTIPQIGEGLSIQSVAVTPRAATNWLKIICVCYMSLDAGAVDVGIIALFREGTVDALAAAAQHITANSYMIQLTIVHWVVAGVITPLNYSFRAGAGTNNITVNGVGGSRKLGGVLFSSITVEESRP